MLLRFLELNGVMHSGVVSAELSRTGDFGDSGIKLRLLQSHKQFHKTFIPTGLFYERQIQTIFAVPVHFVTILTSPLAKNFELNCQISSAICIFQHSPKGVFFYYVTEKNGFFYPPSP